MSLHHDTVYQHVSAIKALYDWVGEQKDIAFKGKVYGHPYITKAECRHRWILLFDLKAKMQTLFAGLIEF